MRIDNRHKVKDIKPELAYIDWQISRGKFNEAIGIAAKAFVSKYRCTGIHAYNKVMRAIATVNEAQTK